MNPSGLLLSAETVAKSWRTPAGSLSVLGGIDLALSAGESMAITGSSGSGKSTLLHVLAGLTQPDSGQVRFGGLPLNQPEGLRFIRRESAFVFQDAKLIPGLDVLANVCLPLEHRGVVRSSQRRVAGAWLERVGLAGRESHFPRQLSGGELMRAAIARALIAEPKLVFADEPTGSLDRATALQIEELLLEACRKGTGLFLVTHNRDLASRMQGQRHLAAGRLGAAP